MYETNLFFLLQNVTPHRHVTYSFLLKSKLHINNEKLSFYSCSLRFLGSSFARILFIYSFYLYFPINAVYRNMIFKFLKDRSKLSQVLQQLNNNRRRRRKGRRRRSRRSKETIANILPLLLFLYV